MRQAIVFAMLGTLFLPRAALMFSSSHTSPYRPLDISYVLLLLGLFTLVPLLAVIGYGLLQREHPSRFVRNHSSFQLHLSLAAIVILIIGMALISVQLGYWFLLASWPVLIMLALRGWQFRVKHKLL